MYVGAIFVLVAFSIQSISASRSKIDKHSTPASHDWDILIFSQRWPVTVCYEWQEKSNKNSCIMPTLKGIWTVHGIWPTKIGTEGPFFCNSSWKFDPSQLWPMQKQLEIYWLNIEKNTPLFSFWKHEWQKHGTCAATLEELNSESVYFRTGLNWIDKYDMATILAKGGITPNMTRGYQAEEIYDAINTVLKTKPMVQCVNDKKTKESFISEIRICFDKNLTLIDCNGPKDIEDSDNYRIITNCNTEKPVMYLNSVPNPPTTPPPTKIYPQKNDLGWLIDAYKFVSFLRWFTL